MRTPWGGVGVGWGTLPAHKAGSTHLDEVLVDPLGESFLLYTVPFI